MLKKLLTLTIITATLTVGTAAYAKDNHSNNGRWKNEYSQHKQQKHKHVKPAKHAKHNHHKHKANYSISKNDRIIINNYYKGYSHKRPHFNNHRVYSTGYMLPAYVSYSPLPRKLSHRLHHYHDTEYVVVDNNVYLLDIATRLILDVISLSSFR